MSSRKYCTLPGALPVHHANDLISRHFEYLQICLRTFFLFFLLLFCAIFTVLEPWLLETCVKRCRKQLCDTVLSAIYVPEWV